MSGFALSPYCPHFISAYHQVPYHSKPQAEEKKVQVTIDHYIFESGTAFLNVSCLEGGPRWLAMAVISRCQFSHLILSYLISFFIHHIHILSYSHHMSFTTILDYWSEMFLVLFSWDGSSLPRSDQISKSSWFLRLQVSKWMIRSRARHVNEIWRRIILNIHWC